MWCTWWIGLTWCSGRQGIAPCCGAAWHWALTVSLLHTHTYTQIRMTLVVNGPDAWHAGWARSSRESGSATCCRPSFRREHPGVSLLWLHPAFGLNVAALIGAVIFGVTLCKLFRSDWKRADWQFGVRSRTERCSSSISKQTGNRSNSSSREETTVMPKLVRKTKVQV